MGFSLALAQDDTAILHEYAHGDRDAAITAFVRRHQRFVYTVALRQLSNNHDDAEDASQDVFVRAVRSLESFKGGSSLQTWLYRITVNVCHSMRRKAKLRTWFVRTDDGDDLPEVMDHNPNPEQELLNSAFSENLSRMLDQLPEKQRETFCLRYFDELSYEEISEILGTSVGGLKANYFHAVKKLAAFINESDQTP
jgi:RNA polymerase sigma-70 factor (ECF subfamily)